MKPGDFVMLCYGSANRDHRKFENPVVHNITRKPKAHLGFGGGVHVCLGSALARLACKVSVEELLMAEPHFTVTEEEFHWIPPQTSAAYSD